jgi:UDP-N-acetylmuramate-alanine ligase
MLTAGIIGSEGKLQTASLINSILTSSGKKISVLDSKNLLGLDLKRIKNYLCELEKNKVEILLLKISINDIDIFISNDFRFDVLVYTGKVKDISSTDPMAYKNAMLRLFSLMAEKGVAIVNADDSELIGYLQGTKHHIVTYGFNTKASITTSSIGDAVFKDGFICYLQRALSDRTGEIIEPQEYKLNLESNEFDTHSLLAAASFAIINGIDLNGVNGL